jgi:hypothetical protein
VGRQREIYAALEHYERIADSHLPSPPDEDPALQVAWWTAVAEAAIARRWELIDQARRAKVTWADLGAATNTSADSLRLTARARQTRSNEDL